MTTPNKIAESGNIDKLEVFSSRGGGSKDLSPGVVGASYYESILDNTVRFTVVIADTGNSDSGGKSINALQELKLSGSEKVHLTLEDNKNNKLKFQGSNALYIKTIRNVMSSTENITYTLDMVSLEHVADDLLSTEVYKRFDGEVSQSARSILTDILKTSKNIKVDPTSNKVNFLGNGKKPFRLLAEIATRSIPQGGSNSAGYLIYETYDGFNFRAIDKLFTQPKIKLLYNTNYELPSGYDAKILDFHADSTIDIKDNLLSGAYGGRLETFNTYTHIFNPKKAQVSTEEQEPRGGKEIPKLSDDFKKFAEAGELLSKRFTEYMVAGDMFSGNAAKQLKSAKEISLNYEEIIAQSSMTYNKLFTLGITIIIAGDLSLRAGDTVNVTFPEPGSGEEVGIDKELSGNYIIADICTFFTPREVLTKMKLIRDSFGR